MDKFEPSDDHHMSVVERKGEDSRPDVQKGGGVPYHVTYPMMHVMYLPPPSH